MAILEIGIALLMVLSVAGTRAVACDTEYAIDKDLKKCMDKNQTTLGMIECYGNAYAQWDKELNKQYNAILKDLKGDARKQFVVAQQQWIRFRDADTQAIISGYPTEGTFWGIVRSADKVHLVRDRAVQLKQRYLSMHPEQRAK
jgi:uncharacterized protein YecT (DUF1311 family)